MGHYLLLIAFAICVLFIGGGCIVGLSGEVRSAKKDGAYGGMLVLCGIIGLVVILIGMAIGGIVEVW